MAVDLNGWSYEDFEEEIYGRANPPANTQREAVFNSCKAYTETRCPDETPVVIAKQIVANLVAQTREPIYASTVIGQSQEFGLNNLGGLWYKSGAASLVKPWLHPRAARIGDSDETA